MRRESKTAKEKEERARLIRILVLKIGQRCWYCGRQIGEDAVDESTLTNASIDHIVAKSKGGDNNLDNYALACRGCNHAKLDNTAVDLLRWIAWIRSSKFKCFMLKKLDSGELESLTDMEIDLLKS